ncbi:phosphodiester glycosidase family protein [Candidatus Gracilibacteria bacterium]|nr:phosphodiester glycosidase family protein [Candidatus Gracilibacteria bacterium]
MGSVAARTGDVKVLLDANGEVLDIVREAKLRVREGRQVLQGTGAGATWLRSNIEIGDFVAVTTRTDPPLSQFEQAVSGGPLIVEDGRFVEDCMCALRDCSATKQPKAQLLCEDFTTDWKTKHYEWVRMPRSAIGFDEQRETLIVAVADGYQAGYSRGMTQEEFADLLREFGAHTAMELDGGGSATLVLEDKVINRPPDEKWRALYRQRAALLLGRARRRGDDRQEEVEGRGKAPQLSLLIDLARR